MREPTPICGICQSTFANGTCVHVSGRGTTDDPYVPALVIDPDDDNIVECGPNGIGAFLQPVYVDPPCVSCYASIDQVIGFDAVQALEFDKNRYDTDGMHDVDATDTGPIHFKTPGIYLVTLNVRWKKTNDSAATGDMAAFLLKNGTEYLAIDSYPVPGGDSYAKHSISREHPFVAGDFISALVKQDVIDSDNNKMNLFITSERMSPNFTATFLRPIEGMTIIGVDTSSASAGTGAGSGGVGSQYTLNGTQHWETPDTSSLDITGDIDVRAALSMADWTPVGNRIFLSKYSGALSNCSFLFGTDSSSTGKLRFQWVNSSVVAIQVLSSVAPTVSDGANLGVRATLDVSDGSGNRVTTFYTKAITAATALTDIESNSGWTQLGTATTTAGVTNINSAAAPLEGGSADLGASGPLDAGSNLYALVVKNGINGTTVADPDFYHNNSPFTDSSGRTWTKY